MPRLRKGEARRRTWGTTLGGRVYLLVLPVLALVCVVLATGGLAFSRVRSEIVRLEAGVNRTLAIERFASAVARQRQEVAEFLADGSEVELEEARDEEEEANEQLAAYEALTGGGEQAEVRRQAAALLRNLHAAVGTAAEQSQASGTAGRSGETEQHLKALATATTRLLDEAGRIVADERRQLDQLFAKAFQDVAVLRAVPTEQLTRALQDAQDHARHSRLVESTGRYASVSLSEVANYLARPQAAGSETLVDGSVGQLALARQSLSGYQLAVANENRPAETRRAALLGQALDDLAQGERRVLTLAQTDPTTALESFRTDLESISEILNDQIATISTEEAGNVRRGAHRIREAAGEVSMAFALGGSLVLVLAVGGTLLMGRSVVQAMRAQSQLASIVEGADDAILSFDPDGRITSWNPGAERLYGYTAAEALGRPVSLLLKDDGQGEVDALLGNSNLDDDTRNGESVHMRRDGSPVDVSLRLARITDERGRSMGASIIARDVSDRKRILEELESARDQAVQASKAKSEFVANMSHEIRTPMNAVIGMTDLLLDTDLDPVQRDYAETVQLAGEGLLGIINDILDFSKVEAGKLTLESTPFDPTTVVENVVEILAPRAHEKDLEIAVLFRPGLPSRVRGDPGRLRQIVTNLVGNAVKFTERGEVTVRCERVQESDGRVVIRFEVRDTGIGIPAEERKRLFESFYQVQSGANRRHGGTGLGLAISRQLVQLMSGELGVESEPGMGSTFWFTAEFERLPELAEDASAPPQALRGLRALVVDDNASNRLILEQQLAASGLEAGSVPDGVAAIRALRAATEQGLPFAFALLDMRMPGMDGLALASTIRTEPSYADTRLLLLTSSGLRGDAEAASQAGVAAYLTKPVRERELRECLLRLLSPAEEPSPDLVTRHVLSDEARARRPHILVAEDNAVNQKIAALMLEKLGYRTDIVADGSEALEAIERTSYDAVLMDCQMPEMDGYEATAEIRRHEGHGRRIPIIAMTAGAMEGDRERCLAAGMDDYVTKPVRPDALDAALRRWVETPRIVVPQDAGE